MVSNGNVRKVSCIGAENQINLLRVFCNNDCLFVPRNIRHASVLWECGRRTSSQVSNVYCRNVNFQISLLSVSTTAQSNNGSMKLRRKFRKEVCCNSEERLFHTHIHSNIYVFFLLQTSPYTPASPQAEIYTYPVNMTGYDVMIHLWHIAALFKTQKQARISWEYWARRWKTTKVHRNMCESYQSCKCLLHRLSRIMANNGLLYFTRLYRLVSAWAGVAQSL